MRLYVKFVVLILITLGIQLVIDASGGPLDRAQFIMRVGIASMCGKSPGDETLVEAATQLRMRECERETREVRASLNITREAA